MHVFLTGSKGVGKSTLLNGILAYYPGCCGGFRTVRLNTWYSGTYSVHMFSLQGSQRPSQENLLFFCGRWDGDAAERFETLGCRILEENRDTQLLVMDELGPHETKAAGFQAAVHRALEQDRPILGVLQQADDPFLQEVACHPRVHLITVTPENRENWHDKIPEILHILQA